MSRTAHVALLIETSRAYGRGLLNGVIRYQREHGPWSIYFQPRGVEDSVPAWLKTWRGNGILARIVSRRMAAAIKQTGIPVVDLRFGVPGLKVPAVGIDNHTVVKKALDHFLDRGFRRFAFCGYPRGRLAWMDFRADLFQQLVADNGLTCELFTGTADPSNEFTWEQDQKRLARWVRGLRKPVAVMTCNDDRGLQLLDAARRAGVLVPDEVAVVGVDNDEYLCGLATPSLSSVDINTDGIGYQAAMLLDRLMKGHSPPTAPILLDARDVVARESTDILAIDDRELAAALRFIREHACEGIRMSDITQATGMERRTLERRIKALLGRSPKDELTRLQLEQAKRLLVETDLSVKLISLRTGFANSRYFSQVFRDHFGLTPLQFRRSNR